ncbi:MAG: hypothetical protein IKU68_03925 [Oscillospiraceae bacterium]|nr:hypothetical protein [Oscillospiraceae bacterium]
MTKRFFPLLLLLFLFGCSAHTPLPDSLPASSGDQEIPASPELIQCHTQKNLTVFSQPEGLIQDLIPVENGFLLVLESNGRYHLTVYSTGTPVAHRALEFSPELQLHNNGKSVSYSEPDTKQIVLLNTALEETARIHVPPDTIGMPLLNSDGTKLYYCTGSALRVLDLESGISRLIKELSQPIHSLRETLMEDSVLALQTEAGSVLYLRTDTGQQLCRRDDSPRIRCTGNRYAAMIPRTHTAVIYGEETSSPEIFLPRYPDSTPIILSGTQAVTAFHTESGETVLDLYDLAAGTLTASGTLDRFFFLEGGCCANGSIILYGTVSEKPVLLQWDPCGPADAKDPSPYDSESEDPAQYAAQIREKYGVEIRILQEASDARLSAGISPEPEYQDSILYQTLGRLDCWLAKYPEGFLRTLCDSFSFLRICLVRETGEEGKDILCLRSGTEACILLTSGAEAEELYRELFRLAETMVLNRSTALDLWETLNPTGFSYCPNYGTDQRMNGQEWLQSGMESFLDTGSMHSPQEDRVRIMAQAMMPGKDTHFRSPYLQAKLSRLCVGFREAFGLKTVPLWEQYLQAPISP